MKWTAPDTTWISPPAQPRLSENEIHIWRIQLDAAVLERSDTLAPDEEARAARFHLSRDRERFVAARSALRIILGSYLRVNARDIHFDYGPHGKPALRPGWDEGALPSHQALTFNLAHTRGIALCAVACRRAVGVDIEYLRPELAHEPIAERFFSAGEVAALRSLPAPQQPLAFFRCWTRKEAFVKARGEGLAFALDRFEVSLAPDAPPALLNVTGAPAEAGRWSLCELVPAPGYVAALAVEGAGYHLHTWDWAHLAERR